MFDNFFFRNLSCLILTPHVPYKNHYSRGFPPEQGLLPIWSISQFKWLNISGKRKEALMDFFILPIAEIEITLTNVVLSTIIRIYGQFLVKIFSIFFLLYSTIKPLIVSYSLSITSCNT